MKKKGFTLIELLAVIIILAVIALIATPVVLNIIEKIRISAAESSAKGYTKAVEYQIINDGMFDGVSFDGEYDVIDNDLGVVYHGSGPSKGSFIIEKNKVTYGEFCINGYPIKYENDIGKYTPNLLDCGGNIKVPEFIEPEGTELRELCKDAETINKYDEITNFKIKKVEDLVCLSKASNKYQKTFEGKRIMLLSNVDINDSNSYENSESTLYEDVNGNGTVEGLLIELTTESGFKQIGSSTTPFKGTFEGYTYTLSNLYINRPSESNVGLFGYVTDGTIKGVNLTNVNINGNSTVGGLVGYLKNSTINEIVLTGTITGSSSDIGGLVGSSEGINSITSVIVNANTTGTTPVGGIIGRSSNTNVINGVVEGGKINSTNYGGKVSFGGYTGTVYVSNDVSIGRGYIDVHSNVQDGISFNYYENDMLSAYDGALDTWIGGDNDNSGYYFDYDNNGKIVIKNIEKDPIKFTLKGDGTESNPYVISNYQQWKEATIKTNGGYYFKLSNDIDFSGTPYYAFGTITNHFNGNIDGNGKIISNIKINGISEAGIIGYNDSGAIKGLSINNLDINASGNNIGGLIGYSNSGTVLGVNLTNVNINGNSTVGGLVGYLKNSTINEVVLNGTITGSSSDIGGIVGTTSDTNSIISIIINANTTGTTPMGGIVGRSSNSNLINAINESGKVNSTYFAGKISFGGYTGNSYSSNAVKIGRGYIDAYSNVQDGISYSSEHINNLSYYNTLLDSNGNPIIESKNTGDINGTGYYFDYGNDGYIKVVPVGGKSSVGPQLEPNPSIEIDPNYTMTNIVGTTDIEAPTCDLYYVRAVSNGIQASFSCTDNSGAPIVRSLFDSTTDKSAAVFNSIGTLKTGSIRDNTNTVVSTWNIHNTTSQPTPGTCYYFRYGGQDAEGNFSTYVTNICYRGFSE